MDQVAVLEADKISCEIDLSNLTKKLSSANEDIKDLHVKCSTLEADLMKQKTTNQQLSHNPNYVNVNLSASSKVEKGSKVEQLEMTVKACQDKILDYQEALTGKDEVSAFMFHYKNKTNIFIRSLYITHITLTHFVVMNVGRRGS